MKFKRGDTFAFSVYLKDENEEPLIIEIDNMKCEVRTLGDDLIDTLIITQTEIPGEYIFLSDDTSKYPIGELFTDIEVVKDGIKSSSDTITLEIVRDVTK